VTRGAGKFSRGEEKETSSAGRGQPGRRPVSVRKEKRSRGRQRKEKNYVEGGKSGPQRYKGKGTANAKKLRGGTRATQETKREKN